MGRSSHSNHSCSYSPIQSSVMDSPYSPVLQSSVHKKAAGCVVRRFLSHFRSCRLQSPARFPSITVDLATLPPLAHEFDTSASIISTVGAIYIKAAYAPTLLELVIPPTTGWVAQWQSVPSVKWGSPGFDPRSGLFFLFLQTCHIPHFTSIRSISCTITEVLKL